MTLRPTHFVLGALVALGTGAISKEEFDCEEAAKYLEDCCGQDASSVQCGSNCEKIEIREAEAQRILASSCEELCAR